MTTAGGLTRAGRFPSAIGASAFVAPGPTTLEPSPLFTLLEKILPLLRAHQSIHAVLLHLPPSICSMKTMKYGK